jgi:hypothetical protein
MLAPVTSDPPATPLPGPGGGPSRVVRRGATVVRPAGPWTPAVHALLRYLERVGFAGAPRVVGDGFDDQGHEVLTFVEGAMVNPYAWSDDGIEQTGQLLRALHDAGPWNIVARDGLPVALIDWDSAGPTRRLDEIASAAWWNAQLVDDDVAERNALPPAAHRARQLRWFLDGYRLPVASRKGLVTAMIEYAIRDCAAEAVQAGVTPDDAGADPETPWALAWRARSAAWMLRHRTLLENAIT